MNDKKPSHSSSRASQRLTWAGVSGGSEARGAADAEGRSRATKSRIASWSTRSPATRMVWSAAASDVVAAGRANVPTSIVSSEIGGPRSKAKADSSASPHPFAADKRRPATPAVAPEAS